MASFANPYRSKIDDYLICQCCQGTGIVKQIENFIIRDAECTQCKGEGLIYIGKPKDALTLKKEGDQAALKGNYGLAMEKYSKAIDKGSLEAVSNRCLVAFQAGKYQQAIIDATSVIEKTEQGDLRVKALLRRGVAKARLKVDGALEDLSAVLDLQPDHPLALDEKQKLLD